MMNMKQLNKDISAKIQSSDENSDEDYQKYGIKPDGDDLQEEYSQFSFYTRGKFGR